MSSSSSSSPPDPSTYVSPIYARGIFADKVVFCTGGNGSICSTQVRALVYLGANACIVGRNAEKTDKMAQSLRTAREGAKVLGIGNVDVRDMKSLGDSVDRCVKELGGIDFLIAGAAGNFLSPLHDLSSNAMKSVMDIDVLGSFNVTKLCLPHLIDSVRKHNKISSLPKDSSSTSNSLPSPGGRIIYVSATFHYTGMALQTHVSVAKAGVDALMANVAIEYGPRGITSNVITPGPIAGTEGMERLARKPKSSGESPLKTYPDGTTIDTNCKNIPLARYGLMKEIADATVFLFSDAANYVNGEVLVVDGGSWRVNTSVGGRGFEYPDFLLSGEEITGVAGLKKKKGDSKL